MEIKELRVGNYLQGRYIFVEVTEIHANGMVSIKGNPSKFYVEGEKPCLIPIPLTVEVLLKCGAKELKAKRGVLKEFVLKTVRIEISNSGNFYYKNSKTDLQYLHKLQNLFYALRNKELQYNHSQVI